MRIGFDVGSRGFYTASLAPMRQKIVAFLLVSVIVVSVSTYGAEAHAPATVLPEDLLPGWRGASGELVPEKYWSEAIRKLKPIRVFMDRANIAVVVSEDHAQQSGVYIITVVSSYRPINELGREFAWDNEAKILRFKFSKK